MSAHQPTVLVVDDEPVTCELLTFWVRAAGYACISATDAASAWYILRRHSIDVVSLDIQLPDRPGTELLPQIRRQFPDLPVMMLTSEEDIHSAIETLSAGAVGYLLKPVDSGEFGRELDRCLTWRRKQLDRREQTRQLQESLTEQTRALELANEELVHRLVVASSFRDEETGDHILRTGLLSEVLARRIGWEEDRVQQIRLAGSMHDIGKIGIPDSILSKPGRLTAAEFERMKTHTLIGARMLDAADSPVLQMARQIALAHHEKWDGTGYPNGLQANNIPLPAQIVAIADVFDALMHDRVYRPALPEAKALKVLKQAAGTHFQPALVDAFFAELPQMLEILRSCPDGRMSLEPGWMRRYSA